MEAVYYSETSEHLPWHRATIQKKRPSPLWSPHLVGRYQIVENKHNSRWWTNPPSWCSIPVRQSTAEAIAIDGVGKSPPPLSTFSLCSANCQPNLPPNSSVPSHTVLHKTVSHRQPLAIFLRHLLLWVSYLQPSLHSYILVSLIIFPVI